MNVLVSGSHGLVGRALVERLTGHGHRVVALTRPGSGEGGPAVGWDPATGTLERADLERAGPFDAVVHLAGAGIADRRWTPARRAELVRSRVDATRLLVDALTALREPPSVLVSASGVHYYGVERPEELTEEFGPGEGFLSGLCVAWEREAQAATSAGTRVVTLRSGIVLTPRGGVLARMLPAFRLGAGARFGSGRQMVSWVSLDDELGAIELALGDERVAGALNATAPNPVTNGELTRQVARAVHRPALLAVPRIALELAVGPGIARELLFASLRVVPARLTDVGYRFVHPDLGIALDSLLSTEPRGPEHPAAPPPESEPPGPEPPGSP